MDRYIDADEFGTWLANEYFTFGRIKEIPPVITAVHRFPQADVAPVIHAHWIRKRMLSHDGELYCSNCEWTPEVIAVGGTTVHDLQLADVYYCPHCGAKMDEE